MLDLCKLIFGTAIDLLRSRATLEAEIVVLWQQINVLRRANPNRLPFGSIDRLILGSVCGLFPKVNDALAVARPDTVVRWHRAGFRLYWRWKSRRRCGRPTVPLEVRRLIREMSVANRLWGAPRIHGELLKLGIEIGQTSVARYMVRRRGPSVARLEDVPSQPRCRHRRDGFVRGADNLFPAALWIADHGPRPAADPVVWGHRASDGRMDRQSAHSGL
jgi:hypothetical protein